jgi:hypothetical protein
MIMMLKKLKLTAAWGQAFSKEGDDVMAQPAIPCSHASEVLKDGQRDHIISE